MEKIRKKGTVSVFPSLFFYIILLMFTACKSSEKEENVISKGIGIQAINQIDMKMLTNSADTIIIDSKMTFEEAIYGTKAPENIIRQLVLIDVEYYSTDDKLHRGQLVVNKSIEQDIIEIFQLIKEHRFPVKHAIPIVAYNWDDNLSMSANNTSSFCYRTVDKTNRLSRHAIGQAIDINPFFNPLIWKEPYQNRPNMPEGAVYDKNIPGTLHVDHPIVKEFIRRKFTWGHYLKLYYDNHHFHRGAAPGKP